MAKPGRDELIQSNQALEKQLESSDMDSSARKMSKAFQIITEQSPNMIFINKGGRIVYVNRRCTQEMGYSKAEFCAPDFDFMTLIAPESVDLVQSNFVKNMQGQEVAPYEYQLITKKGKKIAAIITTKLIRYQGEAAILGIVTDISERKRAEEDLQYRLKFQNLITKVSSQFVNLYPAQIDDEIDRTLQQIGQFAEADRSYMFQFSDDQKSVSCTHEWCADQIEPTIARIQNAPVDSFQWAMNRFFSGHMLTIPRVADLPPEADSLKEELVQQGIQSVLAVPMIIGGKVIGFIGLDSVREEKMWVEDTSSILKIVGYVFANALENKKTRQALQESEERLRTVYETFPDPVTIIQAEDGRCIDVNSAFSRVTGWSATEVIGKTAAELDIWEDTAERQKLVDGIAEKGKIDNLEARFRLKDGRKITALMSAVLIRLNDRPHILTITRDISELKYAQEEREQLKTQLIQAQKMEAIGTLAGGIAHDFNNILGAIIGYAEMALYDTRQDSMEHYNIDQVLKAGHRAKDLVKQILAFSRKSEQNKQIVSLTPIIKEALNLLRASLPTTIEIKQHIESNLDAIYADPTQIHQVMMNLCTNAGHAMADTGGTLNVSLQNVDLTAKAAAVYPDLSAGPYVKLSISDTGHGMDAATMDRIFDPYFTTKEQDKGTGMGLAVVHGIVKGHGGSIQVESTPGKGSGFDILFPIMEKQTVSETEKLKALPTGSECILLVDDEDSLIELGKNMLVKLGYQVETRTRPVEALETFRADPHKYDLVISDMTMPNMTGDILAAELRQIRADIPIIICTGYSERINEQRAGELGLQGLIMKPFTIRRLAKTVREVLGKTVDF
ncbi:MAG: PAS domain S-box protein [Deltaproteobacteria bacterium]|jgi:PAS domain S-box-containing protein|nr:PAS domain S-box protein [Deltaproteobacteria bacterium]